MTIEATVKAKIHSLWHCGTGQSAAGDIDSVAVRDRFGLPFVPGKTLKGLFRDAMQDMEEMGKVGPGTVVALFGEAGFERIDSEWTAKSTTRTGALAFSNLTLDAELLKWFECALRTQDHANAAKRYREGLYRVIAQTAIDGDSGTAEDGSLRLIECAIPLDLSGTITWTPDPYAANSDADALSKEWIEILGRAECLVRTVGADRTRGLGRCTVTVKPAEVQP